MKNLFFNWKRKDVNWMFAFFSMLFVPFVNAMVMFEIEPEGGGTDIEKTIKESITNEMKSLQESLKTFKKAEDFDKEIERISKKIDDMNVKGLSDQLSELKVAAEKQGLELKAMRESTLENKPKTIESQLKEKSEELKKMVSDRYHSLKLTKAITAASFTDDTVAYRVPNIGEYQRGMPFLRNLFNIVTLGPDTHGAVAYVEQDSPTNNASNVAEGADSASESVTSWTEKTIGSKRIHDFIKISKNQLKDVGYVAGECNRLLDRNMRLKENSQLLTGAGTGNEIAGITTYAQSFSTGSIAVKSANLNDLVRKVALQIRTGSLDKFVPNYSVLNPGDVDALKDEKDDISQYIFRTWADGGPVRLGGFSTVENSLMTANTMLVGDFTLGTIYVWDELSIEMGYINDDFTLGLVTLSAYIRENLLVRDNDVQGFVYISDIADVLSTINLV